MFLNISIENYKHVTQKILGDLQRQHINKSVIKEK